MRTKLLLRVPKPRITHQPSSRNLQIYDEVRMLGQRQVDVARQHGLSQRRVSQICQQFDRWQERVMAVEPVSVRMLQQTGLRLTRGRYQQIYAWAVREILRDREPLTTVRTRTFDGKTEQERTARSQPASPQWLKLALSLSRKILAIDAELCMLGEAVDTSVVEELDAVVDRLMPEIRAAASRLGPSGGNEMPVQPPAKSHASSSSTPEGLLKDLLAELVLTRPAASRAASAGCDELPGRRPALEHPGAAKKN